MRLDKENTLAIIIDFQEKLVPVIADYEKIISSSNILIQGLQELEIPILVSEQYTKGLGETVLMLKKVIHESTPIAEKHTFSCLGCEDISSWIQTQKKKQILILGIETHICVLQTALDLLSNDYQVFVVCDCVGSRSMYDNEIALQRLQSEGARLTTCESVLFELTVDSKDSHFKHISKLIK